MIGHLITGTSVRRKLLLIAALIIVPCAVINLITIPDTSDETLLQTNIAELQAKLENLQSKYITTREEINLLSSQLLTMTDNPHLLNDLQLLLPNTTTNLTTIKMPTVYNFLPHLLNDQNSLRLGFLQSKGRTGVSMVLGVPTVKREVQNYLIPTLKNLIDRMSQQEALDTVIIVMIAEVDPDYISLVAKQIEVQFPVETESGLIEVVAPSVNYYPDFSKVKDTIGDDHQRVVWRTKQNLDYAFLMAYAQQKGTFYVQLEDDILAKKNFITTMKEYALKKISDKTDWLILDFCQLGFIGKLFRTSELPWLIQFFLMFYNDKPVDWLLDHLITTKVCRFDKDTKHCKMAKNELWQRYKPSLFQHIGTHSSLKGKIQKLKDKQFGKAILFQGYDNPAAVAETEIRPYKQYTLNKAYKGETFFWGLLPKFGDHLKFKFNRSIFIKKYLFKSGNVEHPYDKFYNTTVEVLPETSNVLDKNSNNVTEDGYIIVGKFDSLGIAQGTVDKKYGKISVLRLTVRSDSDNWGILSEIQIVEDESS